MASRICCIVEGQGEVQSVPALIHRICSERALNPPVIARPIRWGRDKLMKPGEAERAVQLAVKYAGASGGVLVLVDADDDCPAQAGPKLLARARVAAGAVPVSVSLACREYESWFLAAAECFRGFHGLPADLEAPGNSEEIRGAKEWLRKAGAPGGSYRPGVDQLPFTRRLEVVLARERSASFRRFERVLLELMEMLSPTSSVPEEAP